jgi:hypothetical protein
MDLVVVAPVLFWVLLPNVVDLASPQADPALASRQAGAVLEDRMHFLSLIPTFVVVGLLLAIVGVGLLALVSIALGQDLVGKLGAFVSGLDLSLLALLATAYHLVGAASAAYVQRPVFLRHRKALLDRRWIHRLALRKKDA